jgi:4-amino-4-deoxy-L-arabinose transferase-like glycosyltransferase
MFARGNAADRLITVAMFALAAVFAAMMFVHANANPDLLWQGYYHDRNGHYSFGQDLALATRTGDPLWFLSELEKAKVWPPLHGLVLAAVLLVGGIDHRLGIVPSLIGWTLAVALIGLIARRMFQDRAQDRALGVGAAAIAMTLAIASPAFRLLACDVMLECLGAGLTAAALWAYGQAMDATGAPDSGKDLASHWRDSPCG